MSKGSPRIIFIFLVCKNNLVYPHQCPWTSLYIAHSAWDIALHITGYLVDMHQKYHFGVGWGGVPGFLFFVKDANLKYTSSGFNRLYLISRDASSDVQLASTNTIKTASYSESDFSDNSSLSPIEHIYLTSTSHFSEYRGWGGGLELCMPLNNLVTIGCCPVGVPSIWLCQRLPTI